MVGDRSLGITLPSDLPAEMARDIFAAAETLKLRNYFTYLGQELIDDHAPLNAIGIPTPASLISIFLLSTGRAIGLSF